MEETKETFADYQIDTAYEALQIARLLVDHFKEDYANLTRDSSQDVKLKAYGLFMQAMSMSIYNCCTA